MVRETVRSSFTAAQRVARTSERLRPFLAAPGLLAAHQREGRADGYRQHLLHAEPGGLFSVVALVWLPGQETPVHDHVSWCVTGVYEGREVEERYRIASTGPGERLVATERLVNSVGDVNGFVPPGDIHVVRNPGPGPAISLHVYGADISRLGTSVRRIYPAHLIDIASPAPSTNDRRSAR
nr:cysteine dioxygenase family protein [Streptomyces sp. WAC 01529]